MSVEGIVFLSEAQLAAATKEERQAYKKYLIQKAVYGDDPISWLRAMFPHNIKAEMGPHHMEMWNWVWSIELGKKPPPFAAIWNRGGAKLIHLETPVPTPLGWTTMGDVRVGDVVYDEKGEPCNVVGLSDIEVSDCYKITFRGGSEIVVSDDHLWRVLPITTKTKMVAANNGVPKNWATWTTADPPLESCDLCDAPFAANGPEGERWCRPHYRRWNRLGHPEAGELRHATTRPNQIESAITLTTQEILDAGLKHKVEAKWMIPVAGVLNLPEVELSIDPYVLGFWLGDGDSAGATFTIHNDDAPFILDEVEARGYPSVLQKGSVREGYNARRYGIRELHKELRLLDLLGNKHIPKPYLRSGEKQRRALLAGLCDSDGSPKRSSVTFTNTKKHLAEGVHELAVSLGYRASINEGRATLYGEDKGPVWRVAICAHPSEVFALPRKAHYADDRNAMNHNGRLHFIDSIEPVGKKFTRCLVVDSPNHLFLVGRDMIPTHNSSSAEMAVALLGARGQRKYVLYCSETQDQSDEHINSIATLLGTEEFAMAYPEMADRAVDKYGQAKGWRRDRLSTASGFVIDGIGLSDSVRGLRSDDQRPDLIIIDDVDGEEDAAKTTAKKIRMLTRKLLPTGSPDLAVLAVQNMVHSKSIFARLASKGLPGEVEPADFLMGRILSGPIPAVWDLEWEFSDGIPTIMGGTPSWDGLDLDSCQDQIMEWGISSFLVEAQHMEEELLGGMFDDLPFDDFTISEEQAEAESGGFKATCCWMDPAVTETDRSDSCAIQIDSLGNDGKIYRRYSWEKVSGPDAAMKQAILKAIEYGSDVVGVETDQGGLAWKSIFRSVMEELERKGELQKAANNSEILKKYDDSGDKFFKVPLFREEKAGSSKLSKTDRASRMLSDYERDKIRHIEGTHRTLQRSLMRFPRFKPFDLVDAAYWSWDYLHKKSVTKIKLRGSAGSQIATTPVIGTN